MATSLESDTAGPVLAPGPTDCSLPLAPSGPPRHPSKWWVSGPFPATVRGVDANGHSFEDAVEVDGISASDLTLHLWRRVVVDASLFVVVCIGATPHTLPLRIALKGQVWRVEAKGGGCYGVDCAVGRHRFL